MGLADALRLTVSAGVASAVDPIDGHSLLAAADQALYAAKHSGRNRTVVGRAGLIAGATALGAAV
jgi:PleD family two-component response regulator